MDHLEDVINNLNDQTNQFDCHQDRCRDHIYISPQKFD